MKRKKVSFLALATVAAASALLCCSLVACSSGSQEAEEAQEPQETQVAEPQKDEGAVSITDATGAEFNLDQPVQKVIGTHNPTLNAVVVVGGGGQYLAGFGNKEKADGLYQNVIEGWDDVVSIGKGKDINLEVVASLDADLAVLPERQAAMAEEYAKVDLNSFIALPNKESFDTVKESLARVGALFGENERVALINAEFDSVVSKASDACAQATDKPSVVFMGDDLYEVAFDSMIQTEIINAVGATNAVTGSYKEGEFATVDAETIVKFNPDVIWIPNYATYSVDDVLNDSKLSEVQAVKDGKVYVFPCSLEPWDYPTASTCLGVCWAANNLHPDLFSEDDLMASCDEFYTLVYGKTFTAEELGLAK